jgi:hypothetical protein
LIFAAQSARCVLSTRCYHDPPPASRPIEAIVRRFPIILLILCVASAILLGSHYYIAKRLVLDPGVPEPLRTGLLSGLGLAAASLVLTPIVERTLAPSWSRWMVWPSSIWMGLCFWLLVLLLFSEVLWGLFGVAAPETHGGASWAPAIRASLVACLTLVVGAVALHSGLRPPSHQRVEIKLDSWPRALDGFRIVQISDIHIGPLLDRRFAEHVAVRVNELAPDLVAVTGDLVDGGVRQLADEVAPFAQLRAKHGVFFVTGNHDHYSGAASWVAKVEELGMRALRNERVEIREGDAVFDLIGVDDHRGNVIGADGREDLDRAIEGRDLARPAILLAHDPSTFLKASKSGIALQISGHTHGGQIWPFGYVVRLVIPFVAGHYRRNGSQLYVSRGTGFWGPPMRLFAPSEITELVIRGSA